MDLQNTTLIFADGASSGNPGPGGWGSIVVSPDGQVTELGGREPQTTNNRMELMAVIGALRWLKGKSGAVTVATDSTYVIRGITQWIFGWMKKSWITAEGKEVSNTDLWKALYSLVADRGKENKVSWRYVRGHSGIPGNERVDEIAVLFSKGKRADLYQGPLLSYGIAIHDLPEDTGLPEMRPKDAGPKPKAHCYLSLVNGDLKRHSTWPECEAVVKGRPGARFKKAMNADEEKAILKEWGL